ncbi:MAG: metallopeptidase TldD-related protein [Capsulimonadaceae bacterium]|nr:metallopeptidase TldD-related protein [Capsulimonadaceae bacterium]
MILSNEEIKSITDAAIEASPADEVEIQIEAGERADLRFGRNTPTNASLTRFVDVNVKCAYGAREAFAASSGADPETVRETVLRAAELARSAPESPEYVPLLGVQEYEDVDGWDDGTASLSPSLRADTALTTIAEARSRGLVSSGYWENAATVAVIANSAGLTTSQRATNANYSVTMRSSSGASGWAAAASHRAADIDGSRVTRAAVAKALASENPIELPPGAYQTVLEPSVMADMLAYMMGWMSRREADEGRSYFALNGQRLGDAPFPENIVIRSDPAYSALPSRKWGEGGLPLRPTTWIDHGRVKNLSVSRYWAARNGLEAIGRPDVAIMDGADASLDELVADVRYGLLLGSLFYVRLVDPRTMLLTGLSRDGLFLIEGGKVTRPVVNFRWNESPAALLQSVQRLGGSCVAVGKETGASMVVPPILAREFHFTSVAPST